MIKDFFIPREEIMLNMSSSLYTREEGKSLCQKAWKKIKTLYILSLLVGILTGISEGIIKSLPFIFFVLLIGRFKYYYIEKQIKKDKELIVEALPELMDRVILLLSAGMFIEGIMEKIAKDEEGDLLFKKISGLQAKSKESNRSIIYELSEYAVKTGIRELIRFSNILESNFSKGSDLLEKLEIEGLLLWSAKRKMAEERAKKAESKLSFPLMLLLLSLITITSAPMLMSL